MNVYFLPRGDLDSNEVLMDVKYDINWLKEFLHTHVTSEFGISFLSFSPAWFRIPYSVGLEINAKTYQKLLNLQSIEVTFLTHNRVSSYM